MNYDTGLISRYRSALMGFASILILFAHSISVCDFKSKLVTGILTYGNCGVYAFAFLSGYGLYYAMNSAGGVKKFYFRRFVRLIFPYFICAGLWYGLRYLLIERSLLGFLYELSLLSFWMEHKGAWYVVFCMVFYLTYPLIYLGIRKKRRGIFFMLATIFMIIIGLSVETYSKELFSHMSKIINCHVIGWAGTVAAMEWSEDKKRRCMAGIYAAIALYFILINAIPLLKGFQAIASYKNGMLGMFVCVTVAYMLFLMEQKLALIFPSDILSFLGKMSLELYLTNIFIIQAYEFFGFSTNNQIIDYAIIITVGDSASYLVHLVCQKVYRMIL